VIKFYIFLKAGSGTVPNVPLTWHLGGNLSLQAWHAVLPTTVQRFKVRDTISAQKAACRCQCSEM